MRLKVLFTNRFSFFIFEKKIKKLLKKYQKIETFEMVESVLLPEKEIKFLTSQGIIHHKFSELRMENSVEKLSLIATKIIKNYLNQLNHDDFFKKYAHYRGVDILGVTANDMYIYHYRDFFIFLERLRVLLENDKPDAVLFFSPPKNQFISPERPEISFLYDNVSTYAFLIELTCKNLNIDFYKINIYFINLASLKNKLRNFILTTIKIFKLCGRCFRTKIFFQNHPILLNNKNNIGVIIRGASEYTSIKPVLRYISNNNEKNLQPIILQDEIFRNPSAQKILDQARERYFPIHYFISLDNFLKSYFYGLRLQRGFNKLVGNLCFKNDFQDSNFFSIILSNQDIFKEIIKSMSKVWPETIIFIEELNNFIIKKSPRALITMSMIDHWVGVIGSLGAAHNVQTISLQNASMTIESLPSLIKTSKFLVYNQQTKDGFVSFGADSTKIEVTGGPQYDQYLQPPTSIVDFKKEIQRQIKFSTNDKILLITTQPGINHDNLINWTLEFSKSHGDTFVIIKPHPREAINDFSFWQKIIKREKLKAQIFRDIDVLKLILVSDVVLSVSSTTILSATIIGKPSISLIDPKASTSNLDYLKTPAVIKVMSEESFLLTLKKILYEKNYAKEFEQNRNFFIKKLGTIDGLSSKRVARVIENFIK